LIGYAPEEVRGVRVLGGQTTDLDITLQLTAITVAGVTVTVAVNPIVPRDQVTTKVIVSGEEIRRLPIDDPRRLIALQPGVVDAANQQGLSLRGSRPGEAQVYIDGAPVVTLATRSAYDPQVLQVGTNALEEATVITGALGVSQGNGEAGAIAYATRSGGDRLAGALAYESDEPMGNAISVGLNRFEGSIGGPIPGIEQLRFFLSGVLQGQRSAGVSAIITGGPFVTGIGQRDETGWGWDQVPTFVVGGLDTTVTFVEGGTIRSVDIPRYVQYSGPCGTLGSDASPLAREIKNNCGFGCQGGRLPMNWRTDAQLQGKLLYSYGLGSSVSLTGLASGYERRYWPSTVFQDPGLFQGAHSWSRGLILNLLHQVYRRTEQALALTLNASWQGASLLVGPLDPAYEVTSRDPPLGIALGAIRFTGFESVPFPVTSEFVRERRAGNGHPPLEGHESRQIQPYRLNPMGMASGGWSTAGFGQPVLTQWERRFTARLGVDWQLNRYHRLTLGGEGLWSTIAHYENGNLATGLGYAFHESPAVWALYGADRLDLGDLVLELGVRWDAFNTHALFPLAPGKAYFAWPDWPVGFATNVDSVDAALARETYPGRLHTALSPRLRVSFPVSEHTDLRLSYGKQVQAPDLYHTLDLNDNGFGQTTLFEFAMRHAFTPGEVLDIAFYEKDIRSELSYRSTRFDVPWNPGSSYYAYIPLNVDFGFSRGVDVKFDVRVGSGFAATVGYGFQTSRSTGSDPSQVALQTITQVTGDSIKPAQAVNVTDFDRTHNLTASLSWTTPAGSRLGEALGGLLRNVGIFATARYQSGLPFTRFDETGRPTQGINSSRLPALRDIDLRVTKGVVLGRLDATIYLDARNLFNFRNTSDVWALTGTVVDTRTENKNIDDELARLHNEAIQDDTLSNGGSVNVGNCALWRGDPVDCVALNRAEARFGNGDGLFTLDEQRRAIAAWWTMAYGAQYFYGPPRRIRLGIELTF
jgi:TonB-dependent Receptor Plug Domain